MCSSRHVPSIQALLDEAKALVGAAAAAPAGLTREAGAAARQGGRRRTSPSVSAPISRELAGANEQREARASMASLDTTGLGSSALAASSCRSSES